MVHIGLMTIECVHGDILLFFRWCYGINLNESPLYSLPPFICSSSFLYFYFKDQKDCYA